MHNASLSVIINYFVSTIRYYSEGAFVFKYNNLDEPYLTIVFLRESCDVFQLK
jgi:hypothetical protein